ncbi:uncharacterized protein CIMG_06441 [Coccidioides immitis RS]|uniref:Uncharacterized protein n=1 Tax=Coccidioides immitis (strain RS) TaxID=246410 RepID=A0A0E1RVZ6_COCIM|nr:uncharacterized protein CIMG_06441 [Coccidioides immitis RS]EAS30962.2 hypothetical protein CIMG_06441 [Coccidioides immitis RS]
MSKSGVANMVCTCVLWTACMWGHTFMYRVWALAAMIMSRCCGGHRCRTFVRFLVPCPDFAGRVLVIGRGKEDDDVSEKYKARGIHRPTGIQEPHS